MKKPVVVILLLLVLLGGVPWWVGSKVEQRYQEATEQLVSLGHRVVAHDFHRGWFSSNATTVLELAIANRGGQVERLRLTLQSDIAHGPLSPSAGWIAAMALIDTRLLADDHELFPADYPASIRTRIGFDGSGHTRIDMPRLEQPVDLPPYQLRFGGFAGDVYFDREFDSVRLDGKGQGFSLTGADQSLFDMAELVLRYSVTRGVADLMLGRGEVLIDRFDLTDRSSDLQLALSKIRLATEASADGEQVVLGARYGVESVELPDSQYGPALIELRLENLPAEALARLQQGMRELQSGQMDEAQRGIAAVGLLMSTLPAVLKSNPVIALPELSLVTPDGPLTANLRLQAMALSLTDLAVPQKWLSKLDGEAELRLPEKLARTMLEQGARTQLMQQAMRQGKLEELDAASLERAVRQVVDARIEMAMSQQWLVREGSDLLGVVSLRNGLLTLNGKSIPLQAMLPQ